MSKANMATALITGASAGIGMELARVFAEDGHPLVLVARSADKLRALGAELKQAHGVHCTSLQADLGEPGCAREVFEATAAEGLQVDILVNNAGVLREGRFAEIDLESHLQLIQLNIGALTALTHLFLQPMLERGKGRILNVSSLSTFDSVPFLGAYAASKAFVMSLTEALVVELHGSGVSATALCPGFTDTGMIAREGGAKKMAIPGIPLTSPHEVAQAGYRACMAGTAIEIPGLGNKLVVEFGRYQPPWLKRALKTMQKKPMF